MSDADGEVTGEGPRRPRRSEVHGRGRRSRRGPGQPRTTETPVPSPVPPPVPSPVPSPVDEARPPEPERPRRAARRGAGRPGEVRAPGTAQRRRQRRRWLGVLVVALVLGAAGLVALAIATGGLDQALERVAPTDQDLGADEAPTDTQPSLVLLTHDDTDPAGQASAVSVLAVDRETGEGTVLLVPSATVADVPGYGAFQLREAFAFGQAPLVAVTLDNLLEIRTDGVATLSEQGWAAVLTRVGGFEVDVRARLVQPADQGGQVRFEPGPQFLDGPRLAEYLTFQQEGETELEALPRTQQVLTGLLDALAADPAAFDAVFADGAPMIDTTDPELVRTVLEELTAARTADRVTTLTLPVSPLGTGREDIYRLDGGRAAALVDDRLAASRPTDGVGVGRAVQILNGNGVPGIGQRVAEQLSGGGYRVVLTGNADAFDHRETRIIVYGTGDDEVAVAQDVRDRLGVGIIERSATPQSVVDLTIIVGADFTG